MPVWIKFERWVCVWDKNNGGGRSNTRASHHSQTNHLAFPSTFLFRHLAFVRIFMRLEHDAKRSQIRHKSDCKRTKPTVEYCNIDLRLSSFADALCKTRDPLKHGRLTLYTASNPQSLSFPSDTMTLHNQVISASFNCSFPPHLRLNCHI